ncbi:MAG TPA: hypothetical protein DEP05_03810 [Betaproteobacteria bacterium]|nr:hypothetical protein [Betaproteobacteria bacterium]
MRRAGFRAGNGLHCMYYGCLARFGRIAAHPGCTAVFRPFHRSGVFKPMPAGNDSRLSMVLSHPKRHEIALFVVMLLAAKPRGMR